MTDTDTLTRDPALTHPAGRLPPGLQPAPGEPLTCVIFEVARRAFAVGVAQVREILDRRPITPLPNAPSELLGMIDLRGEGVAVADLSSRLAGSFATLSAAPETDAEEAERIIVTTLSKHGALGAGRQQTGVQTGGELALGVLVDRVLSVTEFEPARIEPAPQTGLAWDSTGLLGVLRLDGRLVMLLDLDAFFEIAPRDPFDFS